MYEEYIEELNKWFEDEERFYNTYHTDEEYCVDQSDVDDFCDFLRKLDPDLISIPCRVGTDGIWFKSEDLKNASFV